MSDIYDALLNGASADTPVDNADLVARLRQQKALGMLGQLSGNPGLQKLGPALQSSADQEAEDVYKTRENAKIRADALAQAATEADAREKDRLAIAANNSQDRALTRTLQQGMLDERLNAGQVTKTDKAQIAAQKVKDNEATAAAGIDKTIDAVDRLANHPGLKSIYGLRGMVYNIPGTDAADAQALLHGLIAKEGLQGMSDMRQQGGTFGRTTNIEFQALQNAMAPLQDEKQGVDQVRQTLLNYKKQLLASKARILAAGDADAAAALGGGGSTTVRQGFTAGNAPALPRATAAAAPAQTAAQRAASMGL